VSLNSGNHTRFFFLHCNVFACAVAALGSALAAAPPLPTLDADPRATVSGVSSGAYMAVQFHVAHSAWVQGAAAIAGGPYYCAQASVRLAYYNCMKPGRFTALPAVRLMREEAERRARAGDIDPTANLAGARAWLFISANDPTVRSEVVDRLHEFYVSYKTTAVIVRHDSAGHGMPTEEAGNADCTASAPPYINDCDYDAAGALLQHLLGRLLDPALAPGPLQSFDQRPFGGGGISLDDEGYVYIPKACESERCRIHVVFHGCRQGRAEVGERFAREAGYNRWAEANRIIVLYPQVVPRRAPYNPNGCWDWWGYTGPDYHTQKGAQIRAVKAMLDRLSEPRRSSRRSPRSPRRAHRSALPDRAAGRRARTRVRGAAGRP
jgi:poly(3-hydroxybutyrate) depolymerase